MARQVIPRPEFRSLGEADIRDALADTNPANPIAREIARMVTGYTENFAEHVRSIGRLPDAILRAKPRTAIEAVAMRLATEAIRAAAKERFE